MVRFQTSVNGRLGKSVTTLVTRDLLKPKNQPSVRNMEMGRIIRMTFASVCIIEKNQFTLLSKRFTPNKNKSRRLPLTLIYFVTMSSSWLYLARFTRNKLGSAVNCLCVIYTIVKLKCLYGLDLSTRSYSTNFGQHDLLSFVFDLK